MVTVELNRKELVYILGKISTLSSLSKEEEDILFDKLNMAKDKSPGGWAGGKYEEQVRFKE